MQIQENIVFGFIFQMFLTSFVRSLCAAVNFILTRNRGAWHFEEVQVSVVRYCWISFTCRQNNSPFSGACDSKPLYLADSSSSHGSETSLPVSIISKL